jgi:hypothetical protein
MSAGAGLLAVGFVHPALLWGLGLAALPLVIHLLSRRQYRRVEWGATRFLLEAEQETRRRIRFEQWLLVALRGLALALLVLLVARPYVRPGLVAALLGSGGSAARVIVIDDSASLGYQVGPAAEFDLLRAAALRLLSWLHQEAPRDRITLALTSAAGGTLADGVALSDSSLAELSSRLAALTPADTRAQPERTLTELVRGLADSRSTNIDFYILSDFQRSDWLTGAGGTAAFAPLQELATPTAARAGEPTRAVRAVLIASGVTPRDNVALADITLERPHVVAGVPAAVRATVVNHGRQPLRDLLLQVDVDGTARPAVPVGLIDPGATRDVALEVTFADVGPHVLALAIGPVDSLRLDDVRRHVLFVKDALNMLLVNGAPAVDPYQEEVFLLRNALAPPGPLSSGLRVEVIEPTELAATALNDYDAVLLCNVPPPNAAAARVLETYVRAGGGLGIFLGSEVGEPAEYNRALYADGAGLLPLPLAELTAPAGQSAGVGLLRTGTHPVTVAFPGDSDALSEGVHFRRYYRCRDLPADEAPPAADPATPEPTAPAREPAAVLARFADQRATPALLERDFGRGRVLLFTSTVDLDWNDWARVPDGSYVVTMLEIAHYLARRTADPTNFIAGQRLQVTISPETHEIGAVFKPPTFPDEPAVTAATPEVPAGPEGTVVLTGPAARHVGVYTTELTTRAGQPELRPLCVNSDPAESDLGTAGAAELAAALAGIPHEFVATAEDFLQGTEQTRRELWPGLLIILLITLFLEQTLAWWFGQPHRPCQPRAR